MEERPERIPDLLAPSSQSLFRKVLERLLGIDQLKQFYASLPPTQDVPEFLEATLASLDVQTELSQEDRQRIPSSGPTLVISNHAFGALDGIILGQTLRGIRSDAKIMANPMLSLIPELADLFFLTQPYDHAKARKANILPTRELFRWVKKGGMAALFPAGEVAHVSWKSWRCSEAKWSPSFVRLLRKTKATVIPVYFEGRNSALFQALGLLHPRLRTVMLVRELWKKRGSRIKLRVGKPIPFDKLPEHATDDELARYFRFRVSMLANRNTSSSTVAPSGKVHPIAPHLGTHELEQELASLPPEQTLLESKGFVVQYALAPQAPNLLHELGRLRETTFRPVGEGTGKSLDLDRFDQYYVHLFIWNREKKEIVGAYRMGKTDEILRDFGVAGLYTSSLFKFRKDFAQNVSPGLEMGRSFIQSQYQRSFQPLLLLWKGIATFVYKHPHYRYLFGPVSISSAYSPFSRKLVAEVMQQIGFDQSLALQVTPRTPLKNSNILEGLKAPQFAQFVKSVDDLSELVSDVDTESHGIPILLKQYLKLGGKLVGFNVDPTFNDALDGLIVVDLLNANRKTVEAYMGKKEYEAYRSMASAA